MRDTHIWDELFVATPPEDMRWQSTVFSLISAPTLLSAPHQEQSVRMIYHIRSNSRACSNRRAPLLSGDVLTVLGVGDNIRISSSALKTQATSQNQPFRSIIPYMYSKSRHFSRQFKQYLGYICWKTNWNHVLQLPQHHFYTSCLSIVPRVAYRCRPAKLRPRGTRWHFFRFF